MMIRCVLPEASASATRMMFLHAVVPSEDSIVMTVRPAHSGV